MDSFFCMLTKENAIMGCDYRGLSVLHTNFKENMLLFMRWTAGFIEICLMFFGDD